MCDVIKADNEAVFDTDREAAVPAIEAVLERDVAAGETHTEFKHVCVVGKRFLLGTGALPDAEPEADVHAMRDVTCEYGIRP